LGNLPGGSQILKLRYPPLLTIVIKPGSGVDPAKGPGSGFHGSTRVNPEKLKKIKVLIFHMKKSM
jgi:hypothetical protein